MRILKAFHILENKPRKSNVKCRSFGWGKKASLSTCFQLLSHFRKVDYVHLDLRAIGWKLIQRHPAQLCCTNNPPAFASASGRCASLSSSQTPRVKRCGQPPYGLLNIKHRMSLHKFKRKKQNSYSKGKRIKQQK